MRNRMGLLGFCSRVRGYPGPVRWWGRGYCKAVRVAGPGEVGRIRTGGQEKPNFLAVLGIVIVLFDAFTDFCGGDANNRVNISIVIRQTVKDLDAEDPFLQVMSPARQGAPDYEPQELGIALAGMEKRGGQQPFQLLLNCSFFSFAGRSPVLDDGLWYQSTPAFRGATTL